MRTRIGRREAATHRVQDTDPRRVWEDHIVHRTNGEPGLPCIDLHLIHEVTSPQAFESLEITGRTVRRPELTLATIDHAAPATSRDEGLRDPMSAMALYCMVRIQGRYGGAQTDALYLSITDPGESVVSSEFGHPPTNGVLSSDAGRVFESTRQILVNTEKRHWAVAARWYPGGAGGSVTTFSQTIGPVCGMVDTENRLIEPGTATPPTAPDSIALSSIETPSPSRPADLWSDIAIPEKLVEGYLCVTPMTPGVAGFLPPREMCTHVSGRDPGTYEIEAR